MDTVTVRELRSRGGEVLNRVVAAEAVTVTRDGTPVAELRPLVRRGLDRVTLLCHWRQLPPVDPDELRRDLDAVP